jgi:hypothetical protein
MQPARIAFHGPPSPSFCGSVHLPLFARLILRITSNVKEDEFLKSRGGPVAGIDVCCDCCRMPFSTAQDDRCVAREQNVRSSGCG